jgi:hypothetical protein
MKQTKPQLFSLVFDFKGLHSLFLMQKMTGDSSTYNDL